jgi:hypothetical protein
MLGAITWSWILAWMDGVLTISVGLWHTKQGIFLVVPTKYGSCSLGGQHGRYQVPNSNCENGNPGSIPCLMRANTPSVCDFTRAHLGWNELAVRSRGNTVFGEYVYIDEDGIAVPIDAKMFQPEPAPVSKTAKAKFNVHALPEL